MFTILHPTAVLMVYERSGSFVGGQGSFVGTRKVLWGPGKFCGDREVLWGATKVLWDPGKFCERTERFCGERMSFVGTAIPRIHTAILEGRRV